MTTTATLAEQDLTPLGEAMAFLAGRCDYAREQDGRGFSAAHTHDGHRYAAIPTTDWTPEMAGYAWHLLRWYKGQLADAGVDFDALPVPPVAREAEEDRIAELRWRAREAAKTIRFLAAQRAKRYVLCDGDGEPVVLSFPYDPTLVATARKIKGREYRADYNGHSKVNVYPFTSLGSVCAFADAHGITYPPEVAALRALADAAAATAAQAPKHPDVTAEDGRLAVRADYDPALNDALRAYNGDYSTWHKPSRSHRPPAHRDPAHLTAIFAAFGLAVSGGARELLEGERRRQDANRAASVALSADPVDVPGLATGEELQPHQFAAVRFTLANRQVILGDEMGFGKTNQALAAVAADNAYPAVVVCRPSLTLNWSKEVARFFPGLSVAICEGSKPTAAPYADIVIIGSAALGTLDKENSTKEKRVFPWVDLLNTLGVKAFILDEGQDGKEDKSNRTNAFLQLAAPVVKANGLVLDLTGTPLVNRPKELAAQLEMLGRIREFGGTGAFLVRHCAGERTRWGRKFDQAHHTIELNDRLRAYGIMIRRTDVSALGLPPCTMSEMVVGAADLDPEVMAAYRAAESGIAAELADVLAQAARKGGGEEAIRAAFASATSTHHLAQITGLRQLAGAAKRPAVTRWVQAQVDAGEKVMVAAHHRAEVDAYADTFGGLKIQGGQTVKAKEADKARFQTDPTAMVISVAIAAGGVGHTLTAARLGIQVEWPWTPGDRNQMAARMHRIGQDRAVEYIQTIAEGTIDEWVSAVVRDKQLVLDAVLDGKTDTADDTDTERAVAAEVAWQLAHRAAGSVAA